MVLAPDSHRLLVSCDDRPGIVAAISGFLAGSGANIVASDQHSTAGSTTEGRFFMRTEFTLDLGGDRLGEFEKELAEAVADLGISWTLSPAGRAKRIAVLASREEHCLLELLWRRRRDNLGGDIVTVVSNHDDLAEDVSRFDVPFHHIPNTPDTKGGAERQMLQLLTEYGPVDLVVLARYMQILSGDFLEEVGCPVINIHHSFLPAFAGADPYRRAHERGVKLIGATAHYVTEELDAGPIIDQDVAKVGHRDDVDALVRLGADVERLVLARAVRLHCEDRVLRDQGTTIVF